MRTRLLGLASVVAVALGCGPGVGGDAPGDTATATQGTSTSGTSVADPTSGVGTTSHDGTTVSIDESTGEVDTGESFIHDPDGGAVACFATSYCDVWTQNCGDGEKCVAWSADGNHDLDGCVLSRCSPIAPDPVPPGGTCTVEVGPWSGFDDCELGAYCWDADPVTLEGVCVANCEGSEANPLCDGALECFVGFGGWITACLPGCDPLAPACGDGDTCTTRGGRPPLCLPTSFGVPAAQAAACDSMVGCGEGFACMAADRVAGCGDALTCCTAVCDPAMPACDAATPVCSALVGGGTAGACTVE